MRHAFNAIFVLFIILLVAFAMVPSSAAYPTSFGNPYPQTVWSPVNGSVSGRLVSSYNTSYGLAGYYVAVVSASNRSIEYANTTTDANGNFTFTGINATYSSTLGEGPDGTAGSLSTGMSMFDIYAYGSKGGENYSAPFGIDTNATGPLALTAYLPASLSYVFLSPSPYLDTTGGMYSVNLTAYVYDNAGNPASDGTVVNFALGILDWTYLNGSLNGNNSQYASVATQGGAASAHYGWFPGNQVPQGYIVITATLNNTPEVNTTISIELKGPSQVLVSPTPAPTAQPTSGPTLAPVVTPSPTPAASQAPSATPTSTPTPLSPLVALVAIIVGAAILMVRKK